MTSSPAPAAVSITVAHTADVDPSVIRAARAVIDLAFAGEFEDDDWDHALGGVHAVAWADGVVVGHASVVQRQVLYDGLARRVGYVEGVGVHPDHQGRGIGGRLMAPIEHVIRRAYDFGALGATDAGMPMYRARGWRPWLGTLGALTPDGPIETPEEVGPVHVLPAAIDPDVTSRLVCDYREGDLW